MASVGTTASTPERVGASRGPWQSVKNSMKRVFAATEAEVSYVKGLTLFGVISTLVVAYFQNLSAYHDRVATLAKDDMAAATQTFTEASGSLSAALALQRRLISDFYAAIPGDANKTDPAYSPRTLARFTRITRTSIPLCIKTTICWHARRKSISTGRVIPSVIRPQMLRRKSIPSTCHFSERPISIVKNSCRTLKAAKRRFR